MTKYKVSFDLLVPEYGAMRISSSDEEVKKDLLKILVVLISNPSKCSFDESLDAMIAFRDSLKVEKSVD